MFPVNYLGLKPQLLIQLDILKNIFNILPFYRLAFPDFPRFLT
jgi:hypothetical protein